MGALSAHQMQVAHGYYGQHAVQGWTLLYIHIIYRITGKIW